MAEKRIDTLYTDTTRHNGTEIYNLISIFDANIHARSPDVPKGQQLGITGVLQNNLSYSIDANWEAKLANINIGGFAKAIKSLHGDVSNTGIITEKFYQGASYLTISPKFRVVDWNGDGSVMATAIKLVNKLLPHGNNETIMETGTDIKEAANSFMEDYRNKIGTKLIAGMKDPTAAISNAALDVITAATGTINRFLWGEPEPVRIKIGNFFDMNNMILESASVEFSKEMTRNGPLYADFDCRFSSKLAMVKHQTGLVARDSSGRQVRIAGAFAEDRTFAKLEADKWKEYSAKYNYGLVEEGWLLDKINQAYGSNITGRTVERIFTGE